MDFADAGKAAEVCGEGGEVAEVEGFDDEFDVGGDAVGVGFAVDGADVGVVVGDGGGELFEHAGAVVAGDDEADGEAGGFGRGGRGLTDFGEAGAGAAGGVRAARRCRFWVFRAGGAAVHGGLRTEVYRLW